MKTTFLLALSIVAAVGLFALITSKGTASDTDKKNTMQTESPTFVKVRFLDEHGVLGAPTNTPRIIKSDEEWKKQLTSEQYKIARAKGTEAAFCGKFTDSKQPGVYYCVCCGLPLFTSEAKFHSGTGWPSFFKPIADENIATHTDHSFGMERTEILCARCDGHLGHVFEDGPAPTGLRYCLNSAAMTFKEDKNLKESRD